MDYDDEPPEEAYDDLEIDPEPQPVPRRRFLKVATCALGGGIGMVMGLTAVRYVLAPVGQRVVIAADEPIDVLGLEQLVVGGPPVHVALVARTVRDAWATVADVPLGAVWLTRPKEREVVALSSICPHLGCSVALDEAAVRFRCPCHDSSFDANGARESGPAPRGLDPLPVEITEAGRVLVTWIRFRPGEPDRTPA